MAVVSVILPSCNSELWIVDSVKSVLEQTHKSLELIVVDDGSTDNTLQLLQRFIGDPRVTIVELEANSGGPATPRNQGIKRARGDYIAFIDSDDVWHPMKLEVQIQAMQEHDLNFLSSRYTSFHKDMPKPQSLLRARLTVQRKTHRQLLCKNWVVSSSAIVSKNLLADLAFNQSEEYIGIEDYLAWLYLHQRPDIQSAVLNANLVFYRLRQDLSLIHI